MKIKVIKRNKKTEYFDENKIKLVALASGLNNKDASKLTSIIANWVSERNKDTVTSLQIRDKMLIEMPKLDKPASLKFIWYEKYKDKNFRIDH